MTHLRVEVTESWTGVGGKSVFVCFCGDEYVVVY